MRELGTRLVAAAGDGIPPPDREGGRDGYGRIDGHRRGDGHGSRHGHRGCHGKRADVFLDAAAAARVVLTVVVEVIVAVNVSHSGVDRIRAVVDLFNHRPVTGLDISLQSRNVDDLLDDLRLHYAFEASALVGHGLWAGDDGRELDDWLLDHRGSADHSQDGKRARPRTEAIQCDRIRYLAALHLWKSRDDVSRAVGFRDLGVDSRGRLPRCREITR